MDTQTPATDPEQQAIIAPPPPIVTQAPPATANIALDAEIHQCAVQLASGSSWLKSIAALTAINTILILFRSSFSLIFGIFTVQVLQGMLAEVGTGANIFGVIISLLTAGLFFMFGFFARQAKSWALIASLVLLILDVFPCFILLASKQYGFFFITLGCHVYVIYILIKAIRANTRLQELVLRRRALNKVTTAD